ncbi:MAG: hypothetical protein ACRDWH_09215 [Acidimicrobiia bacterium]
MNRTARILAVLLAIVLVGGGIYLAYRTGFDNGASAATATAEGARNGTLIVGRPYGWHGGFGFFPFFPLLIFFLIFWAWRPWRRGGGPRGSWGGDGTEGWGPPREVLEKRLNEWHQQAHNEGDADRPRS